MTSRTRTHAIAAVLVAVLAAGDNRHAKAAWQETFEGQQPSWTDAGGDAQYHVVRHERVAENVHGGNGCEWLRIEGQRGSQVYVAHDIGRPHIIEELAPSLWIKSDRPGPYLAVRVVLPRTADSRTGRPMVTTLRGEAYTDVGHWQQLRLTGIPKRLTRQIHLLRMQHGPQVDDREAYLDALLLNVYGGPGVINVWIDDIEVAGHVAAAQPESNGPLLAPQRPVASGIPKAAAEASEVGPLVPVRLPPVQDPQIRPSRAGTATSSVPEAATSANPPATGRSASPETVAPRRVVKLEESILQVDGRPIFPRAIQHRGEPLAVLKRLGFNTVWLQRLPTPELLEEAGRLGLSLICPPPRALTPIAEIGPTFDSILVWDLGSNLTDADLEPTQRWADQIRAADRHRNRPLICCPRMDLRGYSRLANLLLIDRRPLGTSLQLADYAAWLRQQPLLARPGTPLWTTVQTQPNEAVRQQLLAMEPGAAPPLGVPSEQLRLLAYTAVAAGSRGLLFLSDSPLDAPDAETQRRAMALELLNLELGLIEPWAAAGSYVATADSNVPEVTGAMLRAGRARLLLPIWSAPMAQCVPPQSASNALTLVVPGVPEASNAYELTPSGVRSLRHKRVAGGMRITLDEFGLTSQVLLAHDPLIVAAVHRRAAEVGRRAAELERHLAVHKLNTVRMLDGQLSSRIPVPAAAEWLDAARNSLQSCDRQLASGNAPEAAQNAQRAMRSLRLVERAYWDAVVKGLRTPVSSPAAVSFDTLPLHLRLVDRLAGCRFGPSRIAGGDFENIETMMRAGWRYVQQPAPGIRTAVDLAPDVARSGRFGLRLVAVAEDPEDPPVVVETPPVLFTSPPVQVEAGQIVRVYGWARVPAPITGSADGLLVVDSLAGEALADRIGQTDGWRPFVLYRAAPRSGSMCVTFALSGLGEAHLDDVVIDVVEGTAAVSRR